jgi:hypothetical protein
MSQVANTRKPFLEGMSLFRSTFSEARFRSTFSEARFQKNLGNFSLYWRTQ